jgi:UDP-glucose 4-epimerase
MKKILITGGSGLIGRNLLPLLQRKYDVYLLSSQDKLSIDGFSGKILSCDIFDTVGLEGILSSLKPEKLIHLAWGMEAGNYNLQSNYSWLLASMRLLELFQENGGKSVMMAGSCLQYDWTLGGCDEKRTPRTHETIHGNCKNILEDFALSFCASHDLQCIWTRVFFMYGQHEAENRFVANLIISLLKDREAIVQNGSLYRDYLHVEDVAGLMMSLLNTNKSGVFNVGSGEMYNLGSMAVMIGELLNKPDLITVRTPDNTSNRYLFANMDNVRSVTNWQPKYDLESGLLRTIEWWERNV